MNIKEKLIAAKFIQGDTQNITFLKPRPGNNNGSNPIKLAEDWLSFDDLEQVGIQNGDTIYVFVDDTPPPSTTPKGGKRYRSRKTRSRKTRSRKTRSRKTRSRR